MQDLLGQRAYEKIRLKLLAGDLPAGTRLVNRKLAREVGTSAIPVREAISRLVTEGLLDYVPGSGAFVRRPDPSELHELYALREALEPLAAEEAARHATLFEVGELQRVCDDWRALVDEIRAAKAPHGTRPQMERWIDNEERFHGQLLAAARNRWLSKVAGEIRLLSRLFAPHRSEAVLLSPRVATQTWRDHVELLRAVARRDTRGARRLMTAHIRAGRDFMLEHFGEVAPVALIGAGGIP